MSKLLETELQLLREENDILREQVVQLKQLLLPPKFDLSAVLKLTRHQSLIMTSLVLAKGKVVNREALHTLSYALRVTDKETPDIKVIDVQICKLRERCKPWNITINTHRGVGYSLDHESLVNALALNNLTISDVV